MSVKNAGCKIQAACLYCGELCWKQIEGHLLDSHSDETEVVEALAKEGLEKILALKKLEHRGNFKHNMDVLRCGKGELIMMGVPKDYAGYKDCTSCAYCLGFCSRYVLTEHQKKCLFNPYSRGVLRTVREKQLIKVLEENYRFVQTLNPNNKYFNAFGQEGVSEVLNRVSSENEKTRGADSEVVTVKLEGGDLNNTANDLQTDSNEPDDLASPEEEGNEIKHVDVKHVDVKLELDTEGLNDTTDYLYTNTSGQDCLASAEEESDAIKHRVIDTKLEHDEEDGLHTDNSGPDDLVVDTKLEHDEEDGLPKDNSMPDDLISAEETGGEINVERDEEYPNQNKVIEKDSCRQGKLILDHKADEDMLDRAPDKSE